MFSGVHREKPGQHIQQHSRYKFYTLDLSTQPSKGKGLASTVQRELKLVVTPDTDRHLGSQKGNLNSGAFQKTETEVDMCLNAYSVIVSWRNEGKDVTRIDHTRLDQLVVLALVTSTKKLCASPTSLGSHKTLLAIPMKPL